MFTLVSCVGALLSAKRREQSWRRPSKPTLLGKEGIKEGERRPGRMDMAQKSSNHPAPSVWRGGVWPVALCSLWIRWSSWGGCCKVVLREI